MTLFYMLETHDISVHVFDLLMISSSPVLFLSISPRLPGVDLLSPSSFLRPFSTSQRCRRSCSSRYSSWKPNSIAGRTRYKTQWYQHKNQVQKASLKGGFSYWSGTSISLTGLANAKYSVLLIGVFYCDHLLQLTILSFKLHVFTVSSDLPRSVGKQGGY